MVKASFAGAADCSHENFSFMAAEWCSYYERQVLAVLSVFVSAISFVGWLVWLVLFGAF